VAEIDEVDQPARRMGALRRANEVRHQRAEIKQGLRSSKIRIADLLVDPSPSLSTARLSKVLLAVPGYGQVRVDRLLKRLRISPLKTIGALSDRQREELVKAVEAQPPG
jgi:hypothetical protein